MATLSGYRTHTGHHKRTTSHNEGRLHSCTQYENDSMVWELLSQLLEHSRTHPALFNPPPNLLHRPFEPCPRWNHRSSAYLSNTLALNIPKPLPIVCISAAFGNIDHNARNIFNSSAPESTASLVSDLGILVWVAHVTWRWRWLLDLRIVCPNSFNSFCFKTCFNSTQHWTTCATWAHVLQGFWLTYDTLLSFSLSSMSPKLLKFHDSQCKT